MWECGTASNLLGIVFVMAGRLIVDLFRLTRYTMYPYSLVDPRDQGFTQCVPTPSTRFVDVVPQVRRSECLGTLMLMKVMR